MRKRKIARPYDWKSKEIKEEINYYERKHAKTAIKIAHNETRLKKFDGRGESLVKEIAEINALIPQLEENILHLSEGALRVESIRRRDALQLRLEILNKRAPEYRQEVRDEIIRQNEEHLKNLAFCEQAIAVWNTHLEKCLAVEVEEKAKREGNAGEGM